MYRRLNALRSAASLCRQIVLGFGAIALFGSLCAQAADGLAPGTTTWGGLNWGIGIAVDVDVGQRRVGNVTTVGPNNIVVVGDTSGNASVGFVLEAHYILKDFIIPMTKSCDLLLTCKTEVGTGPFVAIEIGNGTAAPTSNSTGPVTGYALGWMVALHHVPFKNEFNPTPVLSDTHSWNIGVGLRVTPNAQVLGDGIVAGQPLPPGDMPPVRLKQEPRLGVMVMSSFSF